MELRWIMYFLLNRTFFVAAIYSLKKVYIKDFVASQSDPCVTHLTLNDTSFRTDSGSLALQSSCGIFPPPPWPKWCRFTSTPGGEIATQCPRNSTCGAQNQLWIDDTLPSYFDGEKSVRTCLQTPSDCCANGKNIVVKNCNGFFVFQLWSVPRCSRFCINATASASLTVSTTKRATIMVRSTVSKRNGTTMITKSKQTDVTETAIPTLVYSSYSTSTVGLQTSTTNTTSAGTYVPTSLTTKLITRKDSSTLQPSEHSRIPVMVGSILGSVFVLAVIVMVSYLLYRKNRKSHDEYKTEPAYESHDDIPKARGIDFVSKKKFKISSISPQET